MWEAEREGADVRRGREGVGACCHIYRLDLNTARWRQSTGVLPIMPTISRVRRQASRKLLEDGALTVV